MKVKICVPVKLHKFFRRQIATLPVFHMKKFINVIFLSLFSIEWVSIHQKKFLSLPPTVHHQALVLAQSALAEVTAWVRFRWITKMTLSTSIPSSTKTRNLFRPPANVSTWMCWQIKVPQSQRQNDITYKISTKMCSEYRRFVRWNDRNVRKIRWVRFKIKDIEMKINRLHRLRSSALSAINPPHFERQFPSWMFSRHRPRCWEKIVFEKTKQGWLKENTNIKCVMQ